MKSTLIVLMANILITSSSVATDPARESKAEFKPFMAYGASATSQEVIAVRFNQVDGKLTPKIVQREPLGFEGAP